MTKKILIVDDEPNILILMEQALEDLEDDYDLELLTANNGQEALKIIQEEQPDLVFLDVMMPHLSGLEVCEKVRKELGLTEIQIIILTAKGQEVDRSLGLEMGANLYITKPFRPKEIFNICKEILELD
jgi:two-component system, OmpR family, alkaline phosphatase synthesis response regulator PhoP